MSYTVDALIAIRKDKWIKTGSIEQDRVLREAIANEIVSDKNLLDEVRQNPEKLIELVFVVVDKNQKTMPFFLNEVQQDFIERLKKAIEDYEKGLIPEISLLVLIVEINNVSVIKELMMNIVTIKVICLSYLK